MGESKQNYHQLSTQEQPLLSSQQDQPDQAILLLLISTITIGSHYGKHSLSSLSTEIMTALESDRTKYGLLFSSQQIPGIILPIFGGFALTYVPHGPAGVVLSSCITLSTAICALAVTQRSYAMLILGRFLFGFCDGALTTLQGAVVAHTLRSRVGAGFGFMLCVSRLSSFAGLTVPAIISNSAGLEFSMWFSVLVCVPSLLSTIAYAMQSVRLETNSMNRHSEIGLTSVLDVIKSFSCEFWSICYLWIVVAGVVFSMTHFIPDALNHHFELSSVRSGLLSGSLVLAAGVCSPVFGIVQDRIGKRASIVTCCCIMLLTGSVLCAAAVSKIQFIGIPQKHVLYLGLVLIGVGFSAAPVTLLACIAIVVDDFMMAAALGVYKAAENGGLALIHVGIGVLRDWRGDYVSGFLLLGALSLSGVGVSLRLAQEFCLETNQDSEELL